MFGGAWSSKRSWEASRFEFGIWFFLKIFFLFFFKYFYINTYLKILILKNSLKK